MRDSYWKRLGGLASDPLWWFYSVPLTVNAILALLNLVGAIDVFSKPFSIVSKVGALVFSGSLLLGAIRGQEVGNRKSMRLEGRVMWAGASILVMLFILETGI